MDKREWLIEKRKKKKLTQTDLAERVSCKTAYISLIENGERSPSVETAKKIADILKFNWTKFYE